jgi:hypothetical protein
LQFTNCCLLLPIFNIFIVISVFIEFHCWSSRGPSYTYIARINLKSSQLLSCCSCLAFSITTTCYDLINDILLRANYMLLDRQNTTKSKEKIHELIDWPLSILCTIRYKTRIHSWLNSRHTSQYTSKIKLPKKKIRFQRSWRSYTVLCGDYRCWEVSVISVIQLDWSVPCRAVHHLKIIVFMFIFLELFVSCCFSFGASLIILHLSF